MNTLSNNFNINRLSFIDTLSDESTLLSGYGIYAHISPSNIEQAFLEFCQQNLSARIFSKHFLRALLR